VVCVETPERLTAPDRVPECHAYRVQDGVDISDPIELFQRDHDPPHAIQLQVHRQGAAPPTLAARRQAAREQAIATLQQALDANIVQHGQAAKQQSGLLRNAGMPFERRAHFQQDSERCLGCGHIFRCGH
jgi:hypothetical protein